MQSVGVARSTTDDRTATINWTKSPRATGYVIRFGIAPDKLYTEYQVGDVDTYTTNGLNKGVPYYFAIDAIGPGGITTGALLRTRVY